MGEVPKNIFTVGCPSIDALISEKEINRNKLLKKFKIDIFKPFTITIQHPVTSELNQAEKQMIETINAIKAFNIQHLIVSQTMMLAQIKY